MLDCASVTEFRAVLFDLFGTLVPAFSRVRHDAVLHDCAAAVGVSGEALQEAWTSTYQARIRGETGDLSALLTRVAFSSGAAVDDDGRAIAESRYAAFIAESLVASEATLGVLATLRQRGALLALVSNANPDVARAWPASRLASLFDEVIFSCNIGYAKPDQRIYDHALRVVGADAREALFVGDGSDNELDGAATAGLAAVLYHADVADAYDPHRPHLETWPGGSLHDLGDVIDLLEPPAAS